MFEDKVISRVFYLVLGFVSRQIQEREKIDSLTVFSFALALLLKHSGIQGKEWKRKGTAKDIHTFDSVSRTNRQSSARGIPQKFIPNFDLSSDVLWRPLPRTDSSLETGIEICNMTSANFEQPVFKFAAVDVGIVGQIGLSRAFWN